MPKNPAGRGGTEGNENLRIWESRNLGIWGWDKLGGRG
jgi:hypothetical protein